MLIGELSKLSGLSRDTLRYYGKIGIIESENRSSGNYRIYESETLAVLRFLKKAQDMGFTLSEIKLMLPSKGSPYSCEEVYEIISDKLKEINDEINKLTNYKRRIEYMNMSCCENSMDSRCSSFQTLWD